jgi:hypothetical protein
MPPGTTGYGKSAATRNAPNRELRRIREQERHETREQFAASMARIARETGSPVIPDGKYVARLEAGEIRYPGPAYRRILAELCGRPFGALGFDPPPGLSVPESAGPGSDSETGGKAVPSAGGRVNMALRNAVLSSGLELPQIARSVGVDPKTVQRWITRGVVPHPRHRWKTCEILKADESEIWPDDVRLSDASLLQGAGHAGSVVTADPDSARRASPAIAELCAVLTDYGSGLGRFSSFDHEKIPSPDDLERDVGIAFTAYQQSRFANAASRASMLLADAQIAIRKCNEGQRARLLRILALSYHVAAAVLSKAGQPDISWIAAERGLNAAEASGTAAVRGSLIRSVAFALLSTGRLESAMRLVESGAGNLESEMTDHAVLSVYGTLLLVGSMAAARFGDRQKTAEYLGEADSAASLLGGEGNHLWTAFGPTNVAIHRVNTASELGDIQTVLDSGLSLKTDAVPVERRVRYLLDVARAHSLTGNREDALGALLTAERLAPEQVHQHYLARKVIAALAKNKTGMPSVGLEKLAMRARAGELA